MASTILQNSLGTHSAALGLCSSFSVAHVDLTPFAIELTDVSRILRHPQNMIVPGQGLQLLVLMFFVQIGLGLILTIVQRVTNALQPKQRTLLTLAFDGHVHCAQINNLLKPHVHNVRSLFRVVSPLASQPVVQRLVLALGVHVPSAEEQPGLCVLQQTKSVTHLLP